ncbi:MAG: GGDEF domain-containing protein [Acidobacteriia bacterium]|nr:GGDEF domain-containing protein [Terriglobia bacterium]
MPSSGSTTAARLPVEDSYLELLAETLDTMDLSARGQFLQRYLRTIAHLDLRESQCLQIWEDTLNNRRELSENLGRAVSLKTSLMDVLSTAGLVRIPVVIEYDELKRLQLNAVTDPLTGLYNRRIFNESLDKELTRAKRYGHPLTLVILDLHRFKEVNDMHGHPKGDEVLRAAADTLRKAMRSSDYAFRIGGDEFALLLPQTDAPQAIALSRRIGVVFAEAIRPLQMSVSVSMDHGVSTCPEDGDQADQLIRIADERLYQLKHANHSRTDGTSVKPEAAPAPAQAPRARATEPPHAPAKTISIESKKPAEKTDAAPAAAATAPARTPAAASAKIAAAQAVGSSLPPQPPQIYAMQRKSERVTMAGTNAYAVLGGAGGHRARVLDLGFGGVALEVEPAETLPANLIAVLHVPILPPVRVNLRPVWTASSPEGTLRVGCCFVS